MLHPVPGSPRAGSPPSKKGLCWAMTMLYPYGVSFPTPTQTSTPGLCFRPGLNGLLGRLGTYWAIPSEASSAIQSIGPGVGLFSSFSKDHMPPRGSPVPSCRDNVGEILTHSPCLGANSPPVRTNDGARCLAKARAIISHPSPQPASQPANRSCRRGGFFRPPTQAKPYPTWEPGCRIDEGEQPLQITRVVSLLLSAFGVQPLSSLQA